MEDSSVNMIISRANEENFVFAFNDFDFSDRVFHLEIIPDDNDNESVDSDKKLKAVKYHEWFSFIESTHYKKFESCDGAKIKSLHISSPILAAKSPFFYKLFKSGTEESQQKNDFYFKINTTEEATLMDLIKFMYGNSLSATSSTDLVDMLITANKFEVTSCMGYCIEMLLKFPMSMESACFYLELPSTLLASEMVKPLVDAAKQYIVACYKDFTKSQDEATKLPLSAVEVVLGSEGLQVISEDEVFNFIVKWARELFPDPQERREILTKRLARLICFSNMSCSKLKEVLACPDFDPEHVSKLVLKALFSKVELSCGQHINASKDLATTDFDSLGRVYLPYCVVYFDMKKDELKSIFPSKVLKSQPFYLGGKQLYLWAQCYGKEQQHLGLLLHKETGTKTCTVDFDFAVVNKSSKEFQIKHKFNNRTLEGDVAGWGTRKLLGITWTQLLSEDNDYVINDILHVRAQITLQNSQA